MLTSSRKLACLLLAGAVLGGTVADASAATARHYYNKGHRYGGYGHHHRYYGGGNPAVGAAVAGTALGIIGLAAGAAAADRYGYYDDPGYGYGYAPGYYNPGYGYGYAPY